MQTSYQKAADDNNMGKKQKCHKTFNNKVFDVLKKEK